MPFLPETMRPVDTLRHWTGRILQLGPSRIALGLAILFALLALASPWWAFTTDLGGGDRVTSVFGWTTVTAEEFDNGVWVRTTIESYARPSFDYPFVASTMGGSYLFTIVYLIVLIAAASLLSLPVMRTMGPLAYLVLALVVVGFGFATLLYPVLVLPGGLAADTDPVPIGGGYWGSSTYDPPFGPQLSLTWGAALGWWFLLLGMICGIIGVALPYLRRLRTMGLPRPQPFRPGP